MRHYLSPFLIGSALLLGCATPNPVGPTGGGGATGAGSSTGSAGTTGSGNTTGSAGTTGGGNTTGSAGTTGTSTGNAGTTGTGGSAPACVGNPAQLINSAAWNCDLATPIQIQGA